MLFLGTAAAECCPNPFCNCEYCNRIRNTSDSRERRRRSAFLLDPENLIDFGPDALPAAALFGVDLSQLKNVFITHIHEDHFHYFGLGFLHMSRTTPPKPTFYMSPEAAAGLASFTQFLLTSQQQQLVAQVRACDDLFNIQMIAPNETVEPEPGYFVTALRGNHQGFLDREFSLNYLFEKNGKCLYYACDTGLFLPETYAALRCKVLDILVLEGTFGFTRLPPGDGHMDVYSICETVDKLIRQGSVTETTKIYITHISHHAVRSHDAYEGFLQERFGERIQLAWDGLRI
ncbi:MAG TPA: MBL fold metallo-hydrolase [Clostridiaceae bacterium]|nr:MBL fold metallo-hydrolase [Clostridiaceae bacterium]